MSNIETRKFSAVLFDLDGTLLDTIEDIAFSLNAVLENHGYPTHSVNRCREMIGFGMRELVRSALPDGVGAGPQFGTLQQKMQESYADHWNVLSRPFDGIGHLLDTIDRLGLKKAILSNKPDRFTRMCADELLSEWNFDVVMGFSDDIAPKPDPTGALMVARQLGLDPATILYVGDSGVDMKTAVAAGMYPLGVLWGYRSENELRATGASRLVSSPHEIVTLLTA
jgi:phosphoglycolate phosphatase